jgi:hypothetical protein
MDPTGDLMLICTALWTLLRGSFNAYVRSSLCSSDLPGGNPTTLNGMILYYRLMTKWSGLGDSTELSRVGLSHIAMSWTHARLTLSLSLSLSLCVCVFCVCVGVLYYRTVNLYRSCVRPGWLAQETSGLD